MDHSPCWPDDRATVPSVVNASLRLTARDSTIAGTIRICQLNRGGKAGVDFWLCKLTDKS
jgi:hypothetical protein